MSDIQNGPEADYQVFDGQVFTAPHGTHRGTGRWTYVGMAADMDPVWLDEYEREQERANLERDEYDDDRDGKDMDPHYYGEDS